MTTQVAGSCPVNGWNWSCTAETNPTPGPSTVTMAPKPVPYRGSRQPITKTSDTAVNGSLRPAGSFASPW